MCGTYAGRMGDSTGAFDVIVTYSTLVAAFARENPWLSAGCIAIALTLAPIQEVVLPHLYGRIIEAITGQVKGVAKGVAKGKGTGGWMLPTVLTIAVLAGSQVLWLLRELLNAHMQPRIDSLVRRRLLDSTPSTGSADAHAGEFMSGLIRTPAIVTYWTNTIFAYVLPYAATIVGIIVYLARRDLALAVALVATFAGLVALLSLAPRACSDAVQDREARLRSVHESADDTVVNRIALASLDAGGKANEAGRGQACEDAYRRAHVGAVLCVLKIKTIAIPLLSIYVAFVIWRGLSLVLAGRMDIGSFVAVFMMTTGLLGTLTWIASLMHDSVIDVGTLTASLRPAQPPAAPPAQRPSHGPPEAGGCGLWHVSVQALDDTTINFPDGRVNFLRGPVGSGKSTALRVLAGIIAPVSGAAYAAGTWGPPGPDGYMPQQPTLLDRTVLENIALGREVTPALRAAVWAMAERLGLAALLRRLPDGLDSPAGKNGSRLSGGQRQIVWLTRVAARASGLLGPRPAYLLLDEPTAAMDEATAKVAMHVIQTLVDEGTVRAAVVITHR